MATLHLFFLLISPLLSLLPFSSPSPYNTTTNITGSTITLFLSPFTRTPLFQNIPPLQKLNYLTSSSLARAHKLKNPGSNTSLTKTPLFPHSYGGYSVSLSFGSPPQALDFVMDTGSSLVWFPCTHLYICSQCNFPNVDPGNITTFVPKLSSTAKILACKNPKCQWLFGPEVQSKCQDCDETSGNCIQNCPDYVVQYGTGTTAGLLLSETLVFSNNTSNVTDFVVGCSIFSDNQPSGMAGFGRGPASLPAQLGLKKFSYCLVSHRFDDTPATSQMVLFRGSYADSGISGGVTYTPILNPSTSSPDYEDYYYVSLRRITVGCAHVRVPLKFLEPGLDGNGGTIFDSGTTFTYLNNEVFELVATEFEKQMANYSRVRYLEIRSGLRPCYNISGENPVVVPELFFHFKGGAKMAFPLADYFSIVGESGVVCMTMVSSSFNEMGGAGSRDGPSIIIGNYQQQNFFVEYDLDNKRLGFRKQICN